METEIKRMEEKLEFLNRMVLDVRQEFVELKKKIKQAKMTFWMSAKHKQQLDEELSDQEERYSLLSDFMI
jgi:hypothetical protein